MLDGEMELRHLRYFIAVAAAENVSRAALKLHVSQPALSRQIRDLEAELGFLLLERSAKSVRLTDAGKTFQAEARAVLAPMGVGRLWGVGKVAEARLERYESALRMTGGARTLVQRAIRSDSGPRASRAR